MKRIMKHITVLLSLIGIGYSLQAQIQNPVHFSYKVEKKDKGYDLVITATMDVGWHIYSQTQPAEAISEPTKIIFDKNPLLTMTGTPKEKGEKEKYEDKQAGIIQYQYGVKADFIQPFTLKSKIKTAITGSITYQTCTNEMCLAPKTVKFSVPVE